MTRRTLFGTFTGALLAPALPQNPLQPTKEETIRAEIAQYSDHITVSDTTPLFEDHSIWCVQCQKHHIF